jgi:hypothetical protein
MPILLAICGVIGYLVGIHAHIVLQVAIIIVLLLLLSRDVVRLMELAAVIPYTMFAFFIIGLVIGDLTFWIAHPTEFDAGHILSYFKP